HHRGEERRAAQRDLLQARQVDAGDAAGPARRQPVLRDAPAPAARQRVSAAGRRFLLARDAAPAGEPGRGASAASHTVPRAAGTPRRLTMLTHGWCHLCDDMRAALAPIAALHGLAVVEIDIDTDPTLGAAYAE